jgi:hypothetical protein
MGYALISERTHKALKRYRCIWCGESILAGQQYVREFSTYCGDIQRHNWHPECKEAADAYFQEGHDDEFSPWDNERPPTAGALEFESWDCALLKQTAMTLV